MQPSDYSLCRVDNRYVSSNQIPPLRLEISPLITLSSSFLFILTAILQFLLIRHHKKEKRYGPSPSNNYTSGAGRKPFWKRNRNKRATRDAELATAPAAGGYGRPSHDTGYTDTTMVGAGAPEPKYGQPGYGQPGYGAQGTNYYHGHNNAATNY